MKKLLLILMFVCGTGWTCNIDDCSHTEIFGDGHLMYGDWIVVKTDHSFEWKEKYKTYKYEVRKSTIDIDETMVGNYESKQIADDISGVLNNYKKLEARVKYLEDNQTHGSIEVSTKTVEMYRSGCLRDNMPIYSATGCAEKP